MDLAPEAIAHSTNLSFKKESSPRLSLSPFSLFFLSHTYAHLLALFSSAIYLSTYSSVTLSTLEQYANTSTTEMAEIKKDGYLQVKEDGIRAWIWSKRYVVLREQTLTFHRNEVLFVMIGSR